VNYGAAGAKGAAGGAAIAAINLLLSSLNECSIEDYI